MEEEKKVQIQQFDPETVILLSHLSDPALPIDRGTFPGISLAAFKDQSSGESIKLTKSNVAEIIHGNESKIPLAAITKSYYQNHGAIALEDKSGQLLKSLPTDQIMIYPIRWYTYNEFIDIPVRGSRCSHSDAIDLELLLREIQTKGWRCPICSKSLSLDTIYIDKRLQAEIRRLKLTYGNRPMPDLILYSKITDTFVPIHNERFIDDFNDKRLVGLGLTADYRSTLITDSSSPIYVMMPPRLDPQTKQIEIPLHIISSSSEEADFANINISIFIFGDKVFTDGALSAISQPLKNVNKQQLTIVAFPSCNIDCGFDEKIMLIGIAMAVSQAPPIVLAAGTSNEFEKIHKNGIFGSQKCSYYTLANDALKVCKFAKFVPLGDTTPFDGLGNALAIACNVKLIEKVKIEDALKDAIKNQKPSFIMEEIDPEVDLLRAESGILLTIPLKNPKNYLTSEEPIQLSLNPNSMDKNSLSLHYKLRISRKLKEELQKEKKILIYLPNFKEDEPHLKYQRIVQIAYEGPINSLSVVSPLMLADCVAIQYKSDDDSGSIISAIMKAKQENPCLVGKEVFVYIINPQGDEIANFKKNCLGAKGETCVCVDNDPKKQKHFEWTFNIWVQLFDGGCDLETFLSLEWLGHLTTGDNHTLPFFDRASQTFTSALQQRFSGVINKSVVLVKDETTLSEKIFTLVVSK